MLQPNDTDWLNGYSQYALYKRPTSDLATHADWKWGNRKKYSLQVEIKRKWEKQYLYQIKWL